jgi:hypothetical protein
MILAPALSTRKDRSAPQLDEFRARCAAVAGVRLDGPDALHGFSV